LLATWFADFAAIGYFLQKLYFSRSDSQSKSSEDKKKIAQSLEDGQTLDATWGISLKQQIN
jgi:hypothetical protein